jgi:hypothetical protein
MKPGELIGYLLELYKRFDPSHETIEAYSEMYFETNPVEDEEDLAFIREIINGCTRYKRLLDVCLSLFL